MAAVFCLQCDRTSLWLRRCALVASWQPAVYVPRTFVVNRRNFSMDFFLLKLIFIIIVFIIGFCFASCTLQCQLKCCWIFYFLCIYIISYFFYFCLCVYVCTADISLLWFTFVVLCCVLWFMSTLILLLLLLIRAAIVVVVMMRLHWMWSAITDKCGCQLQFKTIFCLRMWAFLRFSVVVVCFFFFVYL